MKKRLVLVIVSLFAIIIGVIILVNNVNAEEEGWHFNNFYFGYSGYENAFTLDLYINCSFPEGRPHLYEPNPYWEPGVYETTEKFYLKTPYLKDNITGICRGSDVVFSLEENYPSSGEYILFVNDEHGSQIFSHKFNIHYDFIADVTDINWLYDCSGKSGNLPATYTIGNPIDKNKIDTIGGIELTFTIKNNGDIPYLLGLPSNQDINIDFKFNLYKNGSDNAFFSSKILSMTRSSDSSSITYSGEDWTSKAYIPSGESIEYSVKIPLNKNSLELKNYGSGDYIIDGYIFMNPENVTYAINNNSNTILKINSSGSIPGFEFAFLICAIIVAVLFWKKKRIV